VATSPNISSSSSSSPVTQHLFTAKEQLIKQQKEQELQAMLPKKKSHAGPCENCQLARYRTKKSGSLIITFTILPPIDSSERSAQAVIDDLRRQIDDPNSPINSQSNALWPLGWLSAIQTNSLVAYKLCASNQWKPVGQCEPSRNFPSKLVFVSIKVPPAGETGPIVITVSAEINLKGLKPNVKKALKKKIKGKPPVVSGLVNFFDDLGHLLGTKRLSKGKSTLNVHTNVTIGHRRYLAYFAGDKNYKSAYVHTTGHSGVKTIKVPTQIRMVSVTPALSPKKTLKSKNIVLQALVTGKPVVNKPDGGKVIFWDGKKAALKDRKGKTVSANVDKTTGVAKWTGHLNLPKGVHSITARYKGSEKFAKSKSANSKKLKIT
jgi:hypothetical protein